LEAKTRQTFVFKNEEGYLWDVWEDCHGDDLQNYSFTKQISHAKQFNRIDGVRVAPKYLWDDKAGKNVDTAQDMRDMLNGDFVKILKTEIWEEI